MSDALPARQPEEPRWSRFTSDPRLAGNAELRASTADRDVVAEVLADAYGAGRLDDDEYRERLDKAMSLRTLGEVMPLVSDLVPRMSKVARADRPPESSVKKVLGNGVLSVILLTNAIWLMISLTAGELTYYWPMWPMAAMLIPLIVAQFFDSDRKDDGKD